ncbi:hypothetical protein [Arsenicicoccus piscis]|uniref:Uncharacterized protein n=1 Tax=Arsenicicoccus piscis TaxID=673954 RepID=A0ABQ6HHS1_9MICO|nr:hypothetical protein [Arsenicicoccus piscis]GMA18100.1 hypothetical protein GCM10025862_01210 [Arsenicicoccus piscis]
MPGLQGAPSPSAVAARGHPFGIVAVGAVTLSALAPAVVAVSESEDGPRTSTNARLTAAPAVARTAPALLAATPGRTVVGTSVVLPALAAPALKAAATPVARTAAAATPLAVVAVPTRRTVTLAADGTLAIGAGVVAAKAAAPEVVPKTAAKAAPKLAAKAPAKTSAKSPAKAPATTPATSVPATVVAKAKSAGHQAAQVAWVDPADDPRRRLGLLGLVVALTAAAVGWVFYSGRERRV